MIRKNMRCIFKYIHYRVLPILLSFGLFMFLYLILSEIAKSEFIPTYLEIYRWLIRYIEYGDLQRAIIISVARWINGYVIGAIVGISIGTAMAISRKIDQFLSIPVSTFRFTPAFAWTSLFALLFGATEFSRILLIVIGVSVISLIFTYHGIMDVPAKYIDAARVLGAKNISLYKEVIFPAAFPHIFDGLRVGVGVGWATIIAAEILAAREGLGYLLIVGRQFANVSVLFFAIITIGIIVFITDRIFLFIRRKILRWIE